MFLILQQIEGNLIYPKVVGTSIGLPGMWVLVAVAVGGDLMGVAGMLLMIPLASVLYALAREFTDKRLAAKGIEQEKLQAQLPILKSEFKEKRKKTKEKREKKKRIKEKPQEQPKAEPEVIHEETTEEIPTEVSEEATGEDEE
jgi:outer membrane biosynthesis protein TonB